MKSLWIVCAVLSLSSPQFRQRDSADRVLRSIPCRPALQWGMDHVKDVEAKVRIGQIDHTIRTTQAEKDFLAIAPKKWPWIDYLPFFQDENNQPCYERYQPWLLWAREEKPESEGQAYWNDYRLASRLFIHSMMLEGHWTRERAEREINEALKRERTYNPNNNQ